MALRSYQSFHGLPVTGELDEATVLQMRKARCGFPDLPGEPGLSRFVLHGNRWDHRDLTYKIANPTGDLHQQDIRDALREAFALGSAIAPLHFTEITVGRADITARFAGGAHGDNDPFDGVGNVLAHAFFPPPNTGDLAGDAQFDDAEDWTDIEGRCLTTIHANTDFGARTRLGFRLSDMHTGQIIESELKSNRGTGERLMNPSASKVRDHEWLEYDNASASPTSLPEAVRDGCHPRIMEHEGSMAKAIVLIHGHTDSPYFMTAIGDYFFRTLAIMFILAAPPVSWSQGAGRYGSGRCTG